MVERLTIVNKRIKPKASKILDTYWKFASLRQDIFYKKLNEVEAPWTNDLVLKEFKFTNAYRASDRVSQYLIRNVLYRGNQDFTEVFFRTILFKIFNKIETWEFVENRIGELCVRSFNFKQYSNILNELVKQKKSIYSGAYIMASGKSYFGFERKFQNHLKLIELMLKNGLPEKIANAKSLRSIFDLLLTYPTIGQFLAYQYAIDINYSEGVNFTEMDFVMPGPGAKDGIKKCFSSYGDYTEAEIISYVTELQNSEFARLGIEFKDLFGRPLQLIDCQNLFCEVDKYSRVIHPDILGYSKRKRIKQHYKPKESTFKYWYPPKWLINDKIKEHYDKRKECIY